MVIGGELSIFLKEMITSKIIVSLLAVLVGLYFIKKADFKNLNGKR